MTLLRVPYYLLGYAGVVAVYGVLGGTVRVLLLLAVMFADLKDIQLFLVAVKKFKLQSPIYLSE